MHTIYRSIGTVQFLVTFAVIVLLERQFSLGVTAVIFSSAVVLATLVGSLLLRSSAVGQSSWRNVLASRFMPWAWIGGYGSMQRLCVANLFGSFLFGLGAFVVARNLRQSDYSLERIGGWTVASVLAWIVLTGMVLFLIGQYGKRYYAGASGFRKFVKLVSAPTAALAASVALVVAGLPFMAFVVAIIPISIVFVPIAGLLLIMLIATISGKPIRWN